MAHFACLDENNLVTNVIVVSNFDCIDESGSESEEVGALFCAKLLGGRWVQTSYNHNFRGKFAGIGFLYDENLDVFIPPCPGENYYLNSNHDWINKNNE
jgi:hypothetical protein